MKRKFDYRIIISISILISMLVLFIFWNPDFFMRTVNALIQLTKSIVFLFTYSNGGVAMPLIPNPIRDATIVIPTTIAELIFDFRAWSLALTSKPVFLNFILDVLVGLMNILRYLVYVPYLMLIVLIFRWVYYTPLKNEARGGNSKALGWYKKFEDGVWKPVKRWFQDYRVLNHKHPWPYKWGLLIILLCTNLLAASIDILSWYIVWATSLDLAGTQTVLISIIFDLIIILHKLGPFMNIVLLLLFIDWFRKRDAINLLKMMQQSNEALNNGLGISTLIVGRPGTGKTMMMSSLVIDTEKDIRSRMLNIIMKYSALFVEFPFKKFEQTITRQIQEGRIHTRSQVKKMVASAWDKYVETSDTSHIWGYKGAMGVFVGNKEISLVEALMAYAQAFLLYDMPKPLAITNYALSFDYELVESDDSPDSPFGYFKIFDYDYIGRDRWHVLERIKKYSTIEKYDWRRLLKKKSGDTFNAIGDGHAEGLTELRPERGNQHFIPGKSEDPEAADASNDGFNLSFVFGRHLATIDNDPIIKTFADTQRLTSINSDLWELFEDIVTLGKRNPLKVPMLFSWLDLSVLGWLKRRCDDFFMNDRNIRKVDTLTGHLMKKLTHFAYVKKFILENRFGYESLSVHLERGKTATSEGEKYMANYYLLFPRVRANMYATDCYAEIFDEVRENSTTGFMDAETWSDYRGTIEEFRKQDSYAFDALLAIQNKNRIKEATVYKKQP